MSLNGWIKLYRKSLQSRCFKNPHLWQLWSWCLLKANHEKKWVSVTTGKGETEIEIGPGQFIFGRNIASKELGMKPTTIRKRMMKLKSMQNIDIQSDTHYSVITIRNWYDYQNNEKEKEQPKEQPSDNQVTGKEQPSDTNKNDKNVKNDKNNSCGSKKTDPRIKVFLDWYFQIYEKHFKRKYAIPSGGKTGMQIKNILRSGLSFTDIQICALLFILDEDPFLTGTEEKTGAGYDIGIFLSRMNKYDFAKERNNPRLIKWLVNEKGEKITGEK